MCLSHGPTSEPRKTIIRQTSEKILLEITIKKKIYYLHTGSNEIMKHVLKQHRVTFAYASGCVAFVNGSESVAFITGTVAFATGLVALVTGSGFVVFGLAVASG